MKFDRPRSAYVHVPFCGRRCGYCNFTLLAGRGDLVRDFLNALECEMQLLEKPNEVDTIFIGGGTPTWLALEELATLLQLICRWLPLAEGGEWSCEANPLDCSDECLGLLKSAGVNRLSIGGQSFDDAKLKSLERDHDGEKLMAAIHLALAHFNNVSLDLIFAAPGETLDTWKRDVALSLASGIQHLSTYGLTIERGSAFFGRVLRGKLSEVDELAQLAMYEHVIDQAERLGWEHYEVSSFARPGGRCRHNESYWVGRPWLAFGPGAASFVDGTRRVNHRSTSTYLQRVKSGQSPVQEMVQLTPAEWIRERFVFGMRRMEGVDLTDLACSECPDPEQLFQPSLSRYIEQGFMQRCSSRIRLTRAGLMISDSLWPGFLEPSRQ